MKEILLVFLGGGLGSVARYAVRLALGGIQGLPLSTFVVNVVGSLLIGVLMAKYGASKEHWANFVFMIGFCGGFTTFSTFTMELLELSKSAGYTEAAIYATLSVVLSIAALLLGVYLYRSLS